MSIERSGGGFDVSCDNCPAGFERFERDDVDGFSGVVAEIKRQNWKIQKVGREFIHLCPSCARERHGDGGVQRRMNL